MNDINMFDAANQQFNGTPISQLMNDNNQNYSNNNNNMNRNYDTNQSQAIRPQLSNMDTQRQNIMFQQPSNNIRNLVNDINQTLVKDYNNIQDNVSFDLNSTESNKKKFIKKIKQLEKDTTDTDTDTDTDEDEKTKKLKKIKKHKKHKDYKKHKHHKDHKDHKNTNDDNNEKTDYIAFYNFGKHLSNETKEMILILFLFCFLSLSYVKKTVGTYIPYLNPNETGKYQYIGVIIYGFILSLLFMISKKFLI